ncbi:GNAT family N-acetyltransferase [Nocardia sp. CA-119907]|uniref:GNAT family N-acetyltransferase n=1 Tax=Nocardia sp. CA-119907 TaxID=3239973 RepID=UPI003D98E542
MPRWIEFASTAFDLFDPESGSVRESHCYGGYHAERACGVRGHCGLDISKGLGEPVFRAARLADLDHIAQLEREHFGDLCYQYVVLRQLFDLHGSEWVVAEIGGRVCGYALVGVGNRRRGWVIGLAVAPKYRHRGVGRALLERAVSSCRSALADSVYLTVRPTDQRAVNLYKTSGFHWAGHEGRYFGDGEPRDVLVHTIERQPLGAPFPGPDDKRWLKGGRAPD